MAQPPSPTYSTASSPWEHTGKGFSLSQPQPSTTCTCCLSPSTTVRSPARSPQYSLVGAGGPLGTPEDIPSPGCPSSSTPPHMANAPAPPPWSPPKLLPVCPDLPCARSQYWTQYLDGVLQMPHRGGQSLPLTNWLRFRSSSPDYWFLVVHTKRNYSSVIKMQNLHTAFK